MSTPDPLKETLRALIPPPVEMTLERIAYHEAGHAVAAIKLGWAVESVSIIPDGDRLGVCHQRRPDGATVTVPGSRIDRHGIIRRLTEEELQEKAQAKADRLIETATATFMMAGKAAERIRYRAPDPDVPFDCAEDDLLWVWETASTRTRHIRARIAYVERARTRARKLLTRPRSWQAVEALVAALLERKELRNEEVGEVLTPILRPRQRPA